MLNVNTTIKYATPIGYGALLLWALAASLATPLRRLPTFEVLAIVFSFGFVIVACKLTIAGQWKKIRQPLIVWFIGVAGIFGNCTFFLAAFKHAPAAQVDLINYLWPIMMFLLAQFVLKEKCTWRQMAGVLLGFGGVCVLIIGSHGVFVFHRNYIVGYVFAFLGAFIWATYTFMTRYRSKKIPSEMLGVYCGAGAIISLVCHFIWEHSVMPSLSQSMVIIAMGLFPQGLAYFLWDYGIKNGNYKLLSILAYGNPIISVLLLVVFGMTQFTATLLIASLLVVAGGIMGGYKKAPKKIITKRQTGLVYSLGSPANLLIKYNFQ